PALVLRPRKEWKPLLANRRLAARLGRVRRHERGVRQQALPGAPDLDEVVAVGAIAVEEDHKSTRASRARLKTRSIKFSHSSFSFSGSFSRPLLSAGHSAEPAPR